MSSTFQTLSLMPGPGLAHSSQDSQSPRSETELRTAGKSEGPLWKGSGEARAGRERPPEEGRAHASGAVQGVERKRREEHVEGQEVLARGVLLGPGDRIRYHTTV